MLKIQNIGDLNEMNFAPVRLLKVFDSLADVHGLTLERDFEEYERDVGISHTTMKVYLAAFAAAGIIKFKYRPDTVYLNPAIFITPTALELEATLRAFNGAHP